ncbi:MAG: hypothetical protein GEV06_28640, partial [Luteitalea sp.]|nr:hypothetical protein [Luteitalea sp.]
MAGASPTVDTKSNGYNWTDKMRGHRRDPPPNFVEDRASWVQTNPASTTQIKYTAVLDNLVFESSGGGMFGTTNYLYQPDTADTDIR